MKILTEQQLRWERLSEQIQEYMVDADVFVTPMAKEYLKEHGITLRYSKGEKKDAVMSCTPLEPKGKKRFIHAETGETYGEKPEGLTHLHGNRLIEKLSPRIAFRGTLDSLQADILCLQAEAELADEMVLFDQLGELLACLQQILAAEVKEVSLPVLSLFGLDADGIRKTSHDVKRYIGIEHPIPNVNMGRVALELNRLRTSIRASELAAVQAFTRADGTVSRADILIWMNRLSSAVYIVFCRYVKEGRHGR